MLHLLRYRELAVVHYSGVPCALHLQHAQQSLNLGSNIDQQQARKRAETFVSYGIGVADAAHVAYAESMKADFITCDDKLLKKLAQVELPIWTGNPIAFCNKENLQ